MLTRVACQPAASRARPLRTGAVARSVQRSAINPLLRAGLNQQIRSFRFGMWSSYLNTEFNRELRHRQRILKHKYAEVLHRNPPWDQSSLGGHPKVILKHMLRRYWNPTQPRCSPRFANKDELNNRQQQNRVGADAGSGHTKAPWSRNIYASWVSHYGDYIRFPSATEWKLRLQKGMYHATEQPTAQEESDAHRMKLKRAEADPGRHEQNARSSSAEVYVIDPITNRKVLQKTYGPTAEPASTANDSFKEYRAQFTPFHPPEGQETPGPVHSNGPPPSAELKEYGQVEIDQETSHDNADGHNIESPRYPIMQSEEYALNHLPPEEPDEQYDDFHRYQAYRRDELDEPAPEPTKRYDDLHKYKTYGAREAGNATAEVPRNSDELHEYKPYMYNEDAKVENRTSHYDDLGLYGPYKYREGSVGDSSSAKYDDLDKYTHHKDDDGEVVDSLAPKYEDLSKYNPTSFQDSPVEERPFQQYGDLEKYQKFKYQELDRDNTANSERDVVAESLREFDMKEQELDPAEASESTLAHGLKNLRLKETPAPPSATKTAPRESLERSMAIHNEASDAADREASLNIRKLRSRGQDSEGQSSQRELTGNYVRDFPEEFSGPWGSRTSGSGLKPEAGLESEFRDQETAGIQEAEKKYSDHLSKSANFAKLETSLDRQQAEPKLEAGTNQREVRSMRSSLDYHSRAQAEVDPYSKEPQGLETSYTKECDGERNPITFAKTYGGEPEEAVKEPLSTENVDQKILDLKPLYFRDPEIDGCPPPLSSESDSMAEASRAPEPTVYKILAYDPTMQKIDIAETTSVVPDQASPLSPAEVLLRLSNPTKFFPHFAPLQAEGFEIVSGGGDVLVFRQVRPGKGATKKDAPPVNPIDMMGKPAVLPNAAAFVSPTGFVNYDVPQVEVETSAPAPAPAFRSNIDVRREEPVFSGPKPASHEEVRSRRKRSAGKRVLVGGAWVAGISYALGVVSEYFITGGVDGKGPTGF